MDAAELAQMRLAAEAIARRAGRLLGRLFTTDRAEREKGHAHNLVTDADEASERLIVDVLRERFPDHGIRAEESGSTHSGTTDAAIEWVVDPLDGTNNFAHGFPMFCVTLAALHRGAPVACATYDPLRDELFAAHLGGGASVDGLPLRVSGRDSLARSLVATGFPYDKSSNPDNNLARFSSVMPRVRGIRRAGSAALDLAYVAAGRLDAYWERGTHAWDVAAGILLVTEAGGRVTDFRGGPAGLDGGVFAASNGRIHDELLEALAVEPLGERNPQPQANRIP